MRVPWNYVPWRHVPWRHVPWRHAAVAVAISLCVAAGYLSLRDAPPFATLETQTLGWRFQLRGPVAPPASVAIVALDDRTLAHFNTWPLPRMVLADAVVRAAAAGATVIGLDMLLPELEGRSDGLTSSAGDRALRDALAAADGAVLGVAMTFGPSEPISPAVRAAIEESAFRVVRRDAGEPPPVRMATGALVPAQPFRDVAGLGHVNVPADETSALYHLALAIGFADAYVPGFPVALAARHLDLAPDQAALHLGRGIELGGRFVPSDPALRLVLNHYGPTGTIPTFSLLDLVEGRLPPDVFAGRAVLFGGTALSVGDTFVTPYSGGDLPGVEVLATAAANMIGGDVIERTVRTAGIDLAAILLLGLATFLLAQLPAPGAAVAAGFGLLVGWLALAQLAFATEQLWLDVTFPSLAVLLNASWVVVGRLVFERRLRGVAEWQRQNLSRYHSPLIADFLAKGQVATIDGREQPAAILFIDVAGFTGRSARIGPAETARFLREFHGRVEQSVLRHGGVLEQFTGDGAMVIFGVPRQAANDAAAALACGRDLIAAVTRWSAELVAAGQVPVNVGVGIHYGPVVIARLGGAEQIQLTAAGDTVNLASRLEALTRTHRATIVVSDALAAAVRSLGHDDLLAGFEEVAPQAVRGRDEPVTVWILRQVPA